MTTIVNSAAPAEKREGYGFLIGIMVFVVFGIGILYFGIPALKNLGPLQVNVPAPQINVAAPQVVVPNEVDVSMNPAQ